MVFTTGGRLALELGPATFGLSIAVAAGAGIGYAIYRLTQGSAEISTYGVDFNTEAINMYFGKKSRTSLGNAKSSSKKSDCNNGGGGGGGGEPHDPKDPKKRNTDKVGNMYELFARTGFGAALKQIAEPTKRDFQGAKIFRAMSDLIEYGIKKGDQFYLDMFHKDHVEVFNKLGTMPRTVLRLDGSVDYANLAKVIKEGRSV